MRAENHDYKWSLLVPDGRRSGSGRGADAARRAVS
jgi:hypothetical protein